MKGRLSYIGCIGQQQCSLLHSLIRNSNIIRDVASRNFYLAFLSRSTVKRWVCHSVWWNILVRCQCKANNFSSRSSFVKPTLSWALLRYRLDFDQTLLSLLALLSWKQRQYGDVIAIGSPLPQNSMMLLLITRSRAWSFPNSKQTRRKANPPQKSGSWQILEVDWSQHP